MKTYREFTEILTERTAHIEVLKSMIRSGKFKTVNDLVWYLYEKPWAKLLGEGSFSFAFVGKNGEPEWVLKINKDEFEAGQDAWGPYAQYCLENRPKNTLFPRVLMYEEIEGYSVGALEYLSIPDNLSAEYSPFLNQYKHVPIRPDIPEAVYPDSEDYYDEELEDIDYDAYEETLDSLDVRGNITINDIPLIIQGLDPRHVLEGYAKYILGIDSDMDYIRKKGFNPLHDAGPAQSEDFLPAIHPDCGLVELVMDMLMLDQKDFEAWVKETSRISPRFRFDMHFGNVGYRDDGETVLFDPVYYQGAFDALE